MKEIIASLAVELNDPGITAEAIRKWRERGNVPHRHRLPLMELARARCIQLSADDFKFPKKSEAA